MGKIAKIYKIGYGLSSSHIMGSRKAAITFVETTVVAIYACNRGK